MELVEVAFEGEFIFCPNTLQTLDELSGSSVSLAVVQPPLTDRSELGLEPPGHDIDGDSTGLVSKVSDQLDNCTYPLV